MTICSDNNKKYAVVLLSGGMDSAVCAAIAHSEGFELACLHLNYRQLTEKRELQSFRDVADFYNVKHRLIVDVEYLSAIGGSSLTDPTIEVPKAQPDSDEIPTSYVPFRNANILSIGVSWAEVIGASALFIGAIQMDGSGYPDCRAEFFDSFQRAIDIGTKPDTSIKIRTPLLNMTKKDVVETGLRLGAPFHLTWSCYKSEDTACGECDSCALRLRGFKLAGAVDPIRYKAFNE